MSRRLFPTPDFQTLFRGVRQRAPRRVTRKQLLRSRGVGAAGQRTGSLAHDFDNILRIVIGNLDLAAGAGR